MNHIVAIPTSKDQLCDHFGHCEKFAILEIENNSIREEIYVIPPPHEPGLLPEWLASKGITHVIAGGMGCHELALFNERKVQVITGVQDKPPRVLAEELIHNKLVAGVNPCDH